MLDGEAKSVRTETQAGLASDMMSYNLDGTGKVTPGEVARLKMGVLLLAKLQRQAHLEVSKKLAGIAHTQLQTASKMSNLQVRGGGNA